MKALQHFLEISALRIFSLPIRLLPRPLALEIGAWAGALGWATGIRRSLVLRNLAQAFPELDRAQRLALGRRAAMNFGRTVTEFLRFAGRDRARVGDLVALEGLDELRQALEDNEGALIVTAHLGAWALYVTALAAAGVEAALLVGKQNNPHVDQLILGIPGDAVRFVSKGKQAPRQILECLQEGRVVVMVADHYISSEAVWAPFLGRTASTLPLPGALVAKRRMPLFLLRGLRVEGGTHRVVLRQLEVSSEFEGDDLRLEVARLSNEALGEGILDHPEQYWWYHDRWKVRGKYQQKKKILGQPPTLG